MHSSAPEFLIYFHHTLTLVHFADFYTDNEDQFKTVVTGIDGVTCSPKTLDILSSGLIFIKVS